MPWIRAFMKKCTQSSKRTWKICAISRISLGTTPWSVGIEYGIDGQESPQLRVLHRISSYLMRRSLHWARCSIHSEVIAHQDIRFCFDDSTHTPFLFTYATETVMISRFELQVKNGYRNKRLGRHLLNCAEAIAKQLGIHQCRLTVLNAQSTIFVDK